MRRSSRTPLIAHEVQPALRLPLRARRCRVHRIPPRVRDDRDTPPHSGRDGAGCKSDLGQAGTEIFLQIGLDTGVAEQPDGQITCRSRRAAYGQSIVRHGSRRAPQWISEAVAAFGLAITVLGGIRFARESVPWLVGRYITAAYWFTASTSFANPAVAIARSMTNTFAGIRPADLPGFNGAEIAGALLGLALMTWLLAPARQREV
jgi:hypothetical protein